MLKFILWGAAVVFAYFAWKAGDLRETTGDIAYLKQAIGWGVASFGCVAVTVLGASSKKKDRDTEPARRRR